MKVLSGIRIVEIAGLGPGPFCAMHLADLGADVISIHRESASGEAPAARNLLNRGKRSVWADLKTDEGREMVRALIKDADALIEGMRPGVMERLGLGPEECHAINPRLVYGRMTGWGQHGNLAHAAGHDNNYISLSGALWHASPVGQRPVTPFTVLGDIGGGALYLAVGLLAGILQARATGKGTVVDAAIVDGSAHMLNLLLHARDIGLVGAERGHSVHDSAPFYETYVCADGKHITLGPLEPQFYALLLEQLGLADDPTFAGEQWDKAQWPARREKLGAIVASRAQEEWCRLLEGTDACFAPVLSPDEAAAHPHNVDRGIYYTMDDILQAAPAPRFDGQAYRPAQIAATGEHTQQLQEALSAGLTEQLWMARP